MSVRRQEALDYQAQGRPGKIQVAPTKPFRNQHDPRSPPPRPASSGGWASSPGSPHCRSRTSARCAIPRRRRCAGRRPCSTSASPIFPGLDAANIAYNLLDRLGGAHAIGPILVGMARPVHVLRRGSDVNDIVNLSIIAAVDAQERARAPQA